jgi:hypothetical protein
VAPLNPKKEGSSEGCPKTVKMFSFALSQIRGNGWFLGNLGIVRKQTEA